MTLQRLRWCTQRRGYQVQRITPTTSATVYAIVAGRSDSDPPIGSSIADSLPNSTIGVAVLPSDTSVVPDGFHVDEAVASSHDVIDDIEFTLSVDSHGESHDDTQTLHGAESIDAGACSEGQQQLELTGAALNSEEENTQQAQEQLGLPGTVLNTEVGENAEEVWEEHIGAGLDDGVSIELDSPTVSPRLCCRIEKPEETNSEPSAISPSDAERRERWLFGDLGE